MFRLNVQTREAIEISFILNEFDLIDTPKKEEILSPFYLFDRRYNKF
jgi:hypothetical protein